MNPSPNHTQTPLQLADFRSPPARSRLAPFWFWNGEMSEELVRRQVHQMADAGVGGFFLHARQGLTLPYLSKSWFERVKVAVETAKQRGMEAWLYDEYPYPSGIAGGLLTANHPEFRARLMEHESVDAIGEVPLRHEFPLGRLVSALACPIENGKVNWDAAIDIRAQFGVVLTRELFWRWPMAHIPYNEKRFMADEGRLVLDWTPPQGNWRILVGIEVEQRGFKYYDCFFDPLAPGAAQEFIRLTHEPYAAHLGEHFGTVIPGIFTDETEPPAWSPEIEKALELDFAQLLPALYHDDHPRASEIRYRFRECSLRLFQERWEKPIADWCKAHNLIWAAEKPTWRPAQFAGIAQPSTDAGHRRVGLPPETLGGHDLRANHRAAMAAAEQNSTEEVRCECFHSLGWGATLQDQKWSIDWLTVQGVNRFTPHAFYGTSAGLAKHDAAPSFFAENPYWPHFKSLADYAGRLGLAMSSGREHARLALLHPTESLWVRGPKSKQAREEYEWLMNELVAQHHGFHPVDALALQRATRVDGGLELGHARYETLLIPPLCALDIDTIAAVLVALDGGLQVLMMPPLGNGKLNEIPPDEMTNWPGIIQLNSRADALQKLEIERKLSVEDENGRQIREVWALWRESGAQQLVFIANTSDAEVSAQIEIDAKVGGWENWSLESGETTLVFAQIEGNRSRIELQLPPFGSALLVSSENAVLAPEVPAVALQTSVLPLDGLWNLKLDRPNALRLNRWRIAGDNQNWADPALDDGELSEVQALPLRFLDQVARKWVEALPRVAGETVWYRRHIECDFVPDDLQILIENGAILGDWLLFVNGEAVPRGVFSAREYNGSDKISASVSQLFRRGENLLALRVENAPEMGGLRTPLHLIGGFGLGGEERRALQALPIEAPFGDLLAAGLPHFSGTATYSRAVSASDLAPVVALPGGFADVAELHIAGQTLGVRAWSPYRWAVPDEVLASAAASVELQIAVTNSLLPFVEGQVWDAGAQSAASV
jgi:hypothetical protein